MPKPSKKPSKNQLKNQSKNRYIFSWISHRFRYDFLTFFLQFPIQFITRGECRNLRMTRKFSIGSRVGALGIHEKYPQKINGKSAEKVST